MRKGIMALGVVLLLGLVVLVAAWWRGAEQQETADIEAVRTQLRERVAKGELSVAEAQVRFAEAYANSKQQERKKDRPKLPPELEALGAEIKEQVTKGELTEEEAKARWVEAKQHAGAKGKGKSKASTTKPKTHAEAKPGPTNER